MLASAQPQSFPHSHTDIHTQTQGSCECACVAKRMRVAAQAFQAAQARRGWVHVGEAKCACFVVNRCVFTTIFIPVLLKAMSVFLSG